MVRLLCVMRFSIMHVKEMDLVEDMENVIDAHQREYRRGRGVWRRVDYTDDLFILVRRIRTRKADRYRIFLVEVTTERFVSAMLLDPEIINFRHKEIFYTPTSYILEQYRGRGLFVPLYRWFMNSGFNMKADSRQSEFSNRLWHRLINEYSYLTIADELPYNDTHSRMLNPKRLRMKHFTTLLFNNAWTEENIKDFAKRISREY